MDNQFMQTASITRVQCEQWDSEDALATCRDQFNLAQDLIYLDGNSLGPLPINVSDAINRCVNDEWGRGLIRSWNTADWITLPQRLGDRIGRLIGADKGQVITTDSTSVNLYKALSAALQLRPDRKVIVSEAGNFPTDLYISEGIMRSHPGITRRLAGEDAKDLIELIDTDVAVVLLTHVNYKTAAIHDMQAITQRAHDVGAVVVWDLAHSVGALPLTLDACNVDFAVGCTYKYLNGGPGAPAFVYVATRHQPHTEQPLTGWFAHNDPFAFSSDYQRAPDINQFLTGTPPVLSFVALNAALDLFDTVDMQTLRDKSTRLTGLFMNLITQECSDYDFTIVSPEDDAKRGSHVSLTHTQGYAIVQAMIDRQIIGDFRAPDILRFGFAPLFNRYIDVWDAVAHMKDIMANASWDIEQYQQRRAVT